MILLVAFLTALSVTAYLAVAVHYGSYMAKEGDFRGLGLILGAATWPLWFIIAVSQHTKGE